MQELCSHFPQTLIVLNFKENKLSNPQTIKDIIEYHTDLKELNLEKNEFQEHQSIQQEWGHRGLRIT